MRSIILLLLMVFALSAAMAQDQLDVYLPTKQTTQATEPPVQGVAMRWGQPARSWSLSPKAQHVTSDRPSVASPAWGYYGQHRAVESAEISDRIEIRLQQATFDPLAESPALPPVLAGFSASGPAHDYFLVQFDGPIQAQWRSDLKASGIEVLDYVPDFAYLVRAPAQADLQRLTPETVRWVGPYLPAFRLANPLVELVESGPTGAVSELIVRGFPGIPLRVLEGELIAAGAIVLQAREDQGGGVIVVIQLAAGQIYKLAQMRDVAWIGPRPLIEYANAVARGNTLVAKDLVEQTLGYYGEGQVVAVTDSGLSTGNPATAHQDFAGRILAGGTGAGATCSGWQDDNYHGTHVAGSVLGSGVRSGANPAANHYAGSHAGTAPRALLAVWSSCEDFSGIPMGDPYGQFWQVMYTLDSRLRVNNNSWGFTDSSSFGTYDSFSRETDRFIRDFPDMVAVFAAHNQGRDSNADGVSDFTTITPPATAKNVIAVGASENVRMTGGFNPGGDCSTYGGCWGPTFPADPISNDRISDNANGMAAFSGRGPTLSNRLKPDIVAPGTNIVSARNESIGNGWGVYDQYYLYAGGTSMASPLVAGGAAIVREYFERQFAHQPSAALVKAVLINGAHDMTPGQHGNTAQADVWRRPDINQGWGRMDLANTLIFGSARHPAYFEAAPGLQTGQSGQLQIDIAEPGKELRVTLVWTDAPGLEATHGALVNDLDLEVTDPAGTTHFGFAGLVGQQRDRFNNFEEVRLASAPAGSYTITVSGHNVPAGPQSFALVVTGALDVDGRIFTDRFQND
jgi:subtilisin family serine protease